MTEIRYTEGYIPEEMAKRIEVELEAIHRKYGKEQKHSQQEWLGILTKQLGDLYLCVNIKKESLPEGELDKQVYQIIAACIEWLKAIKDSKGDEGSYERLGFPDLI